MPQLTAEDQQACNRILKWCRSYDGQRAVNGNPGMREYDGRCRVIDLARTTTDKDGFSKTLIYAEAPTWAEVEATLKTKGFMP